MGISTVNSLSTGTLEKLITCAELLSFFCVGSRVTKVPYKFIPSLKYESGFEELGNDLNNDLIRCDLQIPKLTCRELLLNSCFPLH